jgi:hypothetical protein
LESFSYELQFDMHFYMHSYLRKSFYSCKKWVSHLYNNNNNNNDQAFYSQASWGRLEMKPHELKKAGT